MIEKIWGFTTPLVVTPAFELHHLRIKPWHRCSRHEHTYKHNVFYVIRGVLFVDSWLHRDMNTKDIREGEWYSVAPHVEHQFRTDGSNVEALEMYYPDRPGQPLSEDILRYNVGGPA